MGPLQLCLSAQSQEFISYAPLLLTPLESCIWTLWKDQCWEAFSLYCLIVILQHKVSGIYLQLLLHWVLYVRWRKVQFQPFASGYSFFQTLTSEEMLLSPFLLLEVLSNISRVWADLFMSLAGLSECVCLCTNSMVFDFQQPNIQDLLFLLKILCQLSFILGFPCDFKIIVIWFPKL